MLSVIVFVCREMKRHFIWSVTVIAILTGLTTTPSAEHGSLVCPVSNQEIRALLERAIESRWWSFDARQTEPEARIQIDQLFIGALADDAYSQARTVTNSAVSEIPDAKITEMALSKDERGLTATVQYVETGHDGKSTGKAKFHLIKGPAGWRIDQQNFSRL